MVYVSANDGFLFRIYRTAHFYAHLQCTHHTVTITDNIVFAHFSKNFQWR